MRMRVLGSICAAGVSAAAFGNTIPDKPTFTRDVAPILYENCLSCHRAGEGAPMSLKTYDEARPWAKSIKDMVSSRKMPPWFADPNHGTFKNDPTLSETEIATIVKWVDAGAPKGNPTDMPEAPRFTEGWRLGEPDHVINLPEVNVPADGGDYFPDLNFTADVPEDRWVQAVEFRPSNLEVTHHVVIFMNGGIGMNGRFDVLGVWSVGTAPNVYPDGMGRRIEKGQRLMANMHYHPNGKPAVDRTKIGLHFGKGDLQHEVRAALAGSFSLQVPANDANHRETASWYVDRDIQIISLFPHMHLRGKDMRLSAAYPDGKEDILLNVPGYDFNWQLFYYPQEPITLPAGSRVDILAHYDNSSGNPNNPDPNSDIFFGTSTDDEMLFGIFEYIEVGDKPLNAVDEITKFASSFPAGDTYLVGLAMGEARVSTVMHLPRQGDGQWLITFNGAQFSMPIENLTWQGDSCQGDVQFKLGRFGGDVILKGTVLPDGKLDGRLMSDAATPFMIPKFEGQLFVKE